MTSLLVQALGALTCLGFVSAYTCYNCQNATDIFEGYGVTAEATVASCPQPFKPSGVATCQGTACYKIVQTINGQLLLHSHPY